ncbi:anaerobic ribonucleoside-triphosphate reductase [Pseudodesulfovibrio thermohalotolerans]|uniref:anaerobic ribonucleoside-triphosphate reductase n=1 Tax=Pseudodesulfovibrio thermohalotolerans TaxID=2880651 RepID=UPI0024425B50|nr:anaerobic ribonucleoside-triphosphate reductase [Pseudodesulfovibrio thermohalotolerans]WFS63393.1 anaerobic ribonucleoside-triphosphate reductase [Pseudodesulfovibrio thermohalotolerans]
MTENKTTVSAKTMDNAARRISYQGLISLAGMDELKNTALTNLPKRLATHHYNGSYHIHDLEAFGVAPNCLTIDFQRSFPTDKLRSKNTLQRLLGIFDYIRQAIVAIGGDQSGGIGFANFDEDIAWACDQLAISDSRRTRQILRACIDNFIEWINTTRSRYGLECYYVTLNIGLSQSPLGKYSAVCLLDCLQNAPAGYIRPNIVFKTKAELHFEKDARNRELFDSALTTTAVRMIPTYLLCDATPNIDIPPEQLAIMGCRTRVAANLHGHTTAIGRGNLAYVSINLVQIAWKATQNHPQTKRIADFLSRWRTLAKDAAEILLRRKQLLEKLPAQNFPGYCAIDPWMVPFADSERIDAWKHGTLSIGFVGLAESVDIMTQKKIGVDNDANILARRLVTAMRDEVDQLRSEHNCNFTLLATSAESTSGRFARIDWANHRIPAAHKGFYTNSFHIPVDVPLNPIHKMQTEGPFHTMCNGGGISYVELGGPPLGNLLALEDMIQAASSAGVSYFGVNFPKDICNNCGNQGVFDMCHSCDSTDVTHIRRVSGYLEATTSFTSGKLAEIAKRTAHARGGA